MNKNIKQAVKAAVTTVAIGFGFLTSTQGAIITQTQDFTPANVLQEVPYTSLLNFNKFNPSLGTLNSIGMTISTTFNADVAIINLTGVNQPFTLATATIPITVSGPNANYTVTVTAGPFNNVVSGMSPGLVWTYAGQNPITFNNSVSIPVSGLYQGIGTIPFTYSLTDGVGTYGGSAKPWVFFGGLPTAKGDVTLTYDYTPVPEPATYIAGLGALCLFGLTSVSKKKNV